MGRGGEPRQRPDLLAVAKLPPAEEFHRVETVADPTGYNRWVRLHFWLLASLVGVGCATHSVPAPSDDYLRWAAVSFAGERILLHWQKRDMPLQVYLPPPPDGLFEEPDAVWEAVRDAVLEWTDVAEVGLPSFEFVDQAGKADIPFVWAREPDGNWYIAHCAYEPITRRRTFGVNHILVTGRGLGGRVADPDTIFVVALHEMGHALGIAGHSPYAEDIMGTAQNLIPEDADLDAIIENVVPAVRERGLSERDRNTLRKLYRRISGAHLPGAH